MRVLLGLNNQLNSNVFGSRFIKNSKDLGFEFKVLASYKNHHHLDKIDYTLDGLYGEEFYFSNFGFRKDYKLDSKKMDYVFESVREFKPDVVVSDFEINTARIALILDIPLYYCSSFFLLHNFLFGSSFRSQNLKFEHFPYSEKVLVYSPLCNLKLRQQTIVKKLKKQYTWVQPYTEDINQDPDFYMDDEILITSGSTSYLSDALLKKENRLLILNPTDFDDLDMRIHAEYFEKFNIGVNIGKDRKLKFLEMAKSKELEKYVYKKDGNNKKTNIINKYLHEILQEDLGMI